MAYGTPTVPKCEIIAGPGNVYVTAAKERVQTEVAIDFLAGPTELLVLSTARPPRSSSRGADRPGGACARHLLRPRHHQPRTAQESMRRWRPRRSPVRAGRDHPEVDVDQGGLLVANSFDDAVAFTNDFAPEHLSVLDAEADRDPQAPQGGRIGVPRRILAVAVGDYGVGRTRSCRPTGKPAPRGFRRTPSRGPSSTRCCPRRASNVAPTATILARIENLQAHLRSIEVRLGR